MHEVEGNQLQFRNKHSGNQIKSNQINQSIPTPSLGMKESVKEQAQEQNRRNETGQGRVLKNDCGGSAGSKGARDILRDLWALP
jgi:hypothetical protein